MTVVLWLLAMVPPSALFLIAGIWVIRRNNGGVRHVLGIVAIVVGMALVAITLIAVPGIATTFETTVTTSSFSSLEHEVIVGGVGITLGLAVLHPNERVTLFYVAKDTAEGFRLLLRYGLSGYCHTIHQKQTEPSREFTESSRQGLRMPLCIEGTDDLVHDGVRWTRLFRQNQGRVK